MEKAEAAEFVAGHLADLIPIAAQSGLESLAFILRMAELEAASLAAARPPEMVSAPPGRETAPGAKAAEAARRPGEA